MFLKKKISGEKYGRHVEMMGDFCRQCRKAVGRVKASLWPRKATTAEIRRKLCERDHRHCRSVAGVRLNISEVAINHDFCSHSNQERCGKADGSCTPEREETGRPKGGPMCVLSYRWTALPQVAKLVMVAAWAGDPKTGGADSNKVPRTASAPRQHWTTTRKSITKGCVEGRCVQFRWMVS